MNKWYLYQYIYISISIELIIYFFQLHEIINKHVLARSQPYRSPTLSTDTPCPEAERLVTTVNVTPKTTNSNSVLPNTASNDIQQHVNSEDGESNTFISLEVQ
jgi:hypothetical protein